ncbi:MAG: ABC-F family ATP-binding cassette domain-containing protein [Phycisphaeraceae bacterium]|nr:ABC-F family ATP-binding cassette domain-containing protein [Phycisphaeraceae bacterium]
MATLLNARNLAKTFGTHTLFTGVSLNLADGDRLGMIGPNGAGKSTLLKILAGLEQPDEGELIRRRDLHAVYVPQSDQFLPGATPLSVLLDRLESHDSPHHLDAQTRAAMILSQLGFDDTQTDVSELSGGWRKRLSIAAAVALEPDLLMLDEPTNHLDMPGVLWLEQFVREADSAVVVITHDRVFLENTSNRVLELSDAYPGGLFEVKGNYTEFVRRKEEFLEAQSAQQTALAGKVRRDTAWLRQGIQARRTRNKAQIEDAAQRRDQLRELRQRNTAPTRTTSIDFQATQRQTNKLLGAHRIGKSMGDKLLFSKLDLMLSPGMCLGLLGPNGSGKTTLLRILRGDLTPDSGTVKPAAELRIVTFTQHRESLNPTQTLRQALCPVGDAVHYLGKAIHVAGWARRFLFDPTKFNHSVGDLSGGEQARIQIANLMLQPADVLILDEPTNDLDIASLEVLEQSLLDFPGAIVLVTHDRFLLGRLATHLLALDGEGEARHYASFEQWQADQRAGKTSKSQPAEKSEQPPPPQRSKPRCGKLSYKLQRELDGMEEAILAAEDRVQQLHEKAADPVLIADHAAHREVCHQLADAHAAVQKLYERWAQLEAMSDGDGSE